MYSFFLVRQVNNEIQQIDVSEYIEDYTIEIPSVNIQKGNVIIPSISIAVNQKGYKPFQDFVLGNTSQTLFVVKKQDVEIFTGLLESNFQNSFDAKKFKTSLKIEHIATKLKDKKVSLNFEKNSLLETLQEILVKAEVNDLFTLDVNNITGNIQVYDTDVSTIQALEKVAMRYGVIIYFEGRKIKTYSLDYTGNEEGTITTFKSIKKSVSKNKYRNVKIKIPIYKSSQDERVIWYSTYKQVENTTSECFFWIYNQQYVLDGTIEVNIDSNIKYIPEDTIKILFEIDRQVYQATPNSNFLRLEYFNYSRKDNKISFRVKVFLPYPYTPRIVKKMRIVGKPVYVDKEVEIISTIDVNEKNDIEIPVYSSTDINNLQTIADKIAFLFKISKYTITTEHWVDDIEIGKIYRLQDIPTNTNTKALCIGKMYQENTISCQWIPLETYTPSSEFLTFTIPINQNTPVKPPEDIQNDTYQQVFETLSSNEGINNYGFTNLPEDFQDGDIEVKTQFRFVILNVKKQQNLINFASYQIQYKKQGTNDWLPVEPLEFFSENIVIKLDFDTTQQNGNNIPIPTTYDIRIRRKTKANLYGGWYAFQITLNPSNANELRVDIVNINENNFWFDGYFKVGNENQYIQFANDALDIVNAQTKILNNSIVVEEGLQNTTITSNGISTTGYIEATKGIKISDYHYKYYLLPFNFQNYNTIIEFQNIIPDEGGFTLEIPFWGLKMYGMVNNTNIYTSYIGNALVLWSIINKNIRLRFFDATLMNNIQGVDYRGTILARVERFSKQLENDVAVVNTTQWSVVFQNSKTIKYTYQPTGSYFFDISSMLPKYVYIPYHTGFKMNYRATTMTNNELIYLCKFYLLNNTWHFVNRVWDKFTTNTFDMGKWSYGIYTYYTKTTGFYFISTNNATGISTNWAWIDGNNQWIIGYTSSQIQIGLGDNNTNRAVEGFITISKARGGGYLLYEFHREEGTGWNRQALLTHMAGDLLANGFDRLYTAWDGNNFDGSIFLTFERVV